MKRSSLAVAMWVALLGACQKPKAPVGPLPAVTRPDGLSWQTLVVGDGDVAALNDKVEVHYEGRLSDGGVFDSTYERGHVFAFWVGQGMVIKGWDEGILGMKEGETRRLIVPPSLGYGSSPPTRKIPPGETLTFDIQLVDVR